MHHWDELVGLDAQTAYFRRVLENGRYVHAYLFTGPRGSGKRSLAETVALALHCRGEKKPCGVCPACRRMLTGNHPDHVVLDSAKETIGVDPVRDLSAEVAIRPYEGAVRTILLPTADKLTIQAQNALLKTLEEPPGHAVFFLLAENRDRLLPTILSRCMEIVMPRVSRQAIAELLLRQGVPAERARLAAAMADGVVGKAQEWLEGDDGLADQFFQTMSVTGGDALAQWPLFEQNKERAGQILELLAGTLRDMIVFKETGAEALLLHGDRREWIAAQAAGNTLDGLREKLRAVTETERRLAGNAQYQIAVEHMLFTVVEGKAWPT